jgi:formylglycine-generating enzyme required for sulfatase activity
MHQYTVTNEMYEVFDPRHKHCRWDWGQTVHPLADKPGREGEDWCPVVFVTFYDAWCYAKWVGEIGRVGKTYEIGLPTKLQWEHACRAGSKDAYWFGNKETDLNAHEWFTENSVDSTHPVGLMPKNANKLYDMLGNVLEWCGTQADQCDRCGGAFHGTAEFCRITQGDEFDGLGDPDSCDAIIGFRLAAVSVSRAQ